VLDVAVGSIVWYLWGYGLAYGLENSPNEFAGHSQFVGAGFTDAPHHRRDWFFQWAFCATGATIVSGAVAERTKTYTYLAYSIIMTGLIYPVIVYWTWSGQGFLTIKGYSDFAGSGVVHLTGGVGALVGAIMVGPRQGRWDDDSDRFDPHNMGSVVLGTFILWFGWYGFNCGSTLSFDSTSAAQDASLAAVNTTLAASGGGLAVFVVRLRHHKYDLAGTCNGILAGMVCICAGCVNVYPSVAFLSGILGGISMECGHVILRYFKIDDPLDAFPVHGCAGATGVLTRPLFDKVGVDGDMFAAHCLGVLCISAWSGCLSVMSFGFTKFIKKLRVAEDVEEVGTNTEMAQPVVYRPATPRGDITSDTPMGTPSHWKGTPSHGKGTLSHSENIVPIEEQPGESENP